jgi:hypothetical protein
MITSYTDAAAPTPTARLVPDFGAEAGWTRLECFAFRFVFVYFTMFFCGTLLDTGPAPRKLLARKTTTLGALILIAISRRYRRTTGTTDFDAEAQRNNARGEEDHGKAK